jgi:hypothetical protein
MAFVAAAMTHLASSITLLSTKQLLYCLKALAYWPKECFADTKLAGVLGEEQQGESLSPSPAFVQSSAMADEEWKEAAAAGDASFPKTALPATTGSGGPGESQGRGTVGSIRQHLLEQMARECLGRKLLLDSQQLRVAAAAFESAGMEDVADKIRGAMSQHGRFGKSRGGADLAIGDGLEPKLAGSPSEAVDLSEGSSWGAAFAPIAAAAHQHRKTAKKVAAGGNSRCS